MPFKSKKQMKFLYSQKPEVAKKFREHSPNQNLKKLPNKKPKK